MRTLNVILMSAYQQAVGNNSSFRWFGTPRCSCEITNVMVNKIGMGAQGLICNLFQVCVINLVNILSLVLFHLMCRAFYRPFMVF